MKRVFGARKEKPPPPTISEASGKLQTRGDALDEKIRKLDTELLRHREAIRKCRPGPAQDAAKRRALSVLKQKRLYENQREQLYSQQFNMEQTSFALESVQDSVATVQAMKVASKDLKKAMGTKELDIDSIDKMRDEMQDLMDAQQEIQDVLGQSYGVPDDIDETDLMGELDAIEADLTAESEHAGGVPSYMQDHDIPELPAAPAKPGADKEDEFGLPAVPQRN